jgi:hypothetical protein
VQQPLMTNSHEELQFVDLLLDITTKESIFAKRTPAGAMAIARETKAV